MKLAPDLFNRFIQTDISFNRFDEKFKLFLQRLTFFNEPSCQLKGVVINAALDSRAVTVKYRTVTLNLRLFFQLNEQNSASARIEGTLDKPGEGKTFEKLGTFTFNSQGATDFERDADGDPVDLEDRALEIVIHFLTVALKHGAASFKKLPASD